jgi:hypothetical protein
METMKGQDRLPKQEYFQLRLEQAIQNGLTKKANYYRGRLAQLQNSKAPSNSKDKFIKTWKEKTQNMSEGELINECARLINFGINKGETLNNIMAVLSQDCKVDGAILCQAISIA